MPDNPMISVIVPCFNHGFYLNEALQSVYDQHYPYWECLVINDGSTDDTEKIAQDWERKDKRFKYFYKQNGGLSSARNKGLEEANGGYIQFLDSDDIIAIDKFAVSMQQAGTADVIISNFKMFCNPNEAFFSNTITLNKNQFNFSSILEGWDDQFAIPIHCGLFKAVLFKAVRFNESLKAREDWLMWLQIYQAGIQTVFIDQPFALYRYSPNSMSQNRALMNRNLVAAYEVIYDMIPVTYRDALFKKAVKHLGALLEETSTILTNTRQSESYRLGNFFVKNFNKIFKNR